MKNQRINEMRDYILSAETVSLKELSDTFQVSINTVRRYINILTSEDSSIQKVYGGVSTHKKAPQPQSYIVRNQEQNQAKRAISKKAAELIQNHDIVFIDSGTTTRYILDYVPSDKQFTVITNNYYIINAAIEKPEITLVALPGILNRKTLSFSGENSDYLNTYNITKAFMACTGISARDGATNSYPSETGIKQIAVSKADQIYLLADHSKFGISTLMTYCPVARFSGIITDLPPSEAFSSYAQENGSRIILTSGNERTAS